MYNDWSDAQISELLKSEFSISLRASKGPPWRERVDIRAVDHYGTKIYFCRVHICKSTISEKIVCAKDESQRSLMNRTHVYRGLLYAFRRLPCIEYS